MQQRPFRFFEARQVQVETAQTRHDVFVIGQQPGGGFLRRQCVVEATDARLQRTQVVPGKRQVHAAIVKWEVLHRHETADGHDSGRHRDSAKLALLGRAQQPAATQCSEDHPEGHERLAKPGEHEKENHRTRSTTP